MRKHKSNRVKINSSFKRSYLFIAVFAVLGGGYLAFRSFAATPTNSIPSEYISRVYTEALGRQVAQSDWNEWVDYYKKNGCNATSTRNMTFLIYRSEEFASKPYSTNARVLAFYRGAFSREPTKTELDYWNAAMAQPGADFNQKISKLLESSDYAKRSQIYCSAKNFALTGRPVAIAGSMTSEQLQAKIDAAPAGSTILLPKSQTVWVKKRIILRRGITLTTKDSQGMAGRTAYANMARFVRYSTTDKTTGSLIVAMPGSKLQNVWLDGQLWNMKKSADAPGQNVFVTRSNAPTAVSYIRSESASGAQNILVHNGKSRNFSISDRGKRDDLQCTGKISIDHNLVINSANTHIRTRWADGIGTRCENSIISDNEIIDASDVAIIVFHGWGLQSQTAQVLRNKIFQAGNDTFGGIVADPLSVRAMGRNYPDCLAKRSNPDISHCDFRGMLFKDNILWTGPDASFVIMASSGTRAWSFLWGIGRGGASNGLGGEFTNNSTGMSTATVEVPFYISGLYGVTARNNFTDPSKLLRAIGSNPVNTCDKPAGRAKAPPHTALLVNKEYAYAAKTSSKEGNARPSIDSIFVQSNRDKCI